MNVSGLVRRVSVLAAALVTCGGLALFVFPDAAASLPTTLAVADIAALAAVLCGLWIVRTRYRTTVEWIVIPDVEYPLATPTPGDELDEMVYRLTELREGTIKHRERIHERMKEVAVSVIMHREGCSYEAAVTQLEDGEWTDNSAALRFFATAGKGARPSSIVARFKQRISADETAYERQLRETVAAIENVGGFFENAGHEEELEDMSDDRALPLTDLDRDEERTQISDTVWYHEPLQTNHWLGISAFALFALGAGILSSQPALLLGSAVGIAIAGYARIATAPPLADLEVNREVSDESPDPGDEITVIVTVENAGEMFLSDLRLVDRVPPTMRVVDGSPKLGTALRPGETATVQYRLVVDRGEHAWPLQVTGRDISGSVERKALINPETIVRCTPQLRTAVDTPVRLQTSVYDGQVATRVGGDGLEFFSVREYQPGDPQSRIDWKTYARNGEFTTIDFREEHAARVVLLFDARASSYVSPSPAASHALDTSINAAFDVFASLSDAGHLVGIAGFNGISCWLGPSTGSSHRQRARDLFADHPALSPLPPELTTKTEGRYIDPLTHIRRQLPSNTQLFLFSPLTDHFTFEVARRLDGAGHLVTIISPDPTASRTIGHRIARLERIVRINRLRNHGIRVIDWNPDEPLSLEFEHARQRSIQ